MEHRLGLRLTCVGHHLGVASGHHTRIIRAAVADMRLSFWSDLACVGGALEIILGSIWNEQVNIIFNSLSRPEGMVSKYIVTKGAIHISQTSKSMTGIDLSWSPRERGKLSLRQAAASMRRQ